MADLNLRCAFAVEPLPAGFCLGAAVCSYGFAMLAPNMWRPGPGVSGGELARPLRLTKADAVQVVVRQPATTRLEIFVPKGVRRLSSNDVNILRTQIVRMLRLRDEDTVTAKVFAKGNADLAKGIEVGRLFRSPDLFEDLVKTITLCNCGWGRTISMNEKLCRLVGKGAFPTAAAVAKMVPRRLQKICGLGYRAERLVRLARTVVKGELNLHEIDRAVGDVEQAKARVSSIFGLGPFGVANALQLLGHYEHIPADSETARHLRQARGIRSCTPENVVEKAAKVYKKYAPWQFLRYWTELWQTYEARMGGRAFEVNPEKYRLLTSAHMKVKRQPYSLLAPQHRRMRLLQSKPEVPKRRTSTGPSKSTRSGLPSKCKGRVAKRQRLK